MHIQTVLGPIPPDALGSTLMHEHLLCNLILPSGEARNACAEEICLANVWEINYGVREGRDQFRLSEIEPAIEEMTAYKANGGGGVVELTVGGIGPDPEGLRKISKASGCHIVMGCGYYVDDYQSDIRTLSVDDLAQRMLQQMRGGAWETDVRAGLIGEIGCSHPWTELEERVLRAAVLVQQETGAALNVHPGRHPDQPLKIVRKVAEWGGDPSRTIISHIERTVFEMDDYERVADTGCILEFDMFGEEQSHYPQANIDLPNDAVRLKVIRALIDRGHLEQIVISQDICVRTRTTRYGGHGYSHIHKNIIPLMRRRAFTELEIDAIMTGNPKRLLTLDH